MKRLGFLMVLGACSLYGQWENPDKRLTVYPSHVDYDGYNNSWTIAVRDTMVHIFWEHRLGDNPGELYYIRSINSGSSFDTDTRLTTGDSHFPSVAVRDSIVHIVWYENRDGNTEIYYNRSVDDGGTWGIDDRLTNNSAESYCPSVAVCDSMVHVVWYDGRDGNFEIYYNRSVDNGETWGIINKKLTDDPAPSGYPSVAVCDSIVHIVWIDERAGNLEIYYNRSIDNGETWGIDNKRLTDNSAYSGCPSIAVCDSIVHIVWYDWRDSDYEIYYNRSIDNGETWGIDNKRLTNNSAYSGDPSIAVCDSAVHVVWVDERDSDYEIYYNRSVNDGETWGSDERLTDAAGKSERVSVACWNCDYDYDVHIAWTDWRHGASNSEIYYKRHKCENTNVEESDKRLEIGDCRLEVYPNPSFGDALIKYELPEKANMTLRIYDISGRLVNMLYSGTQEKGYHKVNVGANGCLPLPTGIYFIQLEAHTGLETSDYKTTRKLTIIR